jgi:serine/threonine protein kinase
MAHFPSVGEDFGAFRITRQLGRGGMGVVFAAEQVGLGRTVALKVLSPELAEQADYRQRFAREASVLARVDSPHIISIFDHGEHDGCLYIATQYVAGGDLSVALDAHGPVPAAPACEIAAQLAFALSDAHQAGIIHRDLKPSNVLLRSISSDVFAYLCDFGIAQDRSPGLTVPGAVAGTFAYLAPERTRGEPATPAADLYALGCVLWTALTARTPYAGTDVEIGMAHVSAPVPQLMESSSVAAAINALLRTAMAKDPASRYSSADAMSSALQEIAHLARSTPHPPLVPRPPDAPAVPPTRPARPPYPSHPSPPSYPSHPSGAPVPRQQRPGRTRLVLVSAAAAMVVIAGGITAAVALNGEDAADDGPTGSPLVIATPTPTPTPVATPSPAPTPAPTPSPTPTPGPKPFYPKVPAASGVQISLGPASLRAPAGWGRIDDGIVDNGAGARDYDDFEGYYSSVFIRRSVPKVPLDDIALLDIVAQSAVESIDSSNPDLSLIRSERLEPAWLDGVQAARTRAAYRDAGDNLELAEETWFLMKGRFLYRVTFQHSRIDSLDERRAQIDPMVKSFRFQ